MAEEEKTQSLGDAALPLKTDEAQTSAGCTSEEQQKNDESPSVEVSFKVLFNKVNYEITWEESKTISSLKQHIEGLTGVPVKMQKLMFKGLLKDNQTLVEAKITSGIKIMLIGSRVKDILSINKEVKSVQETSTTPKVKSEPLCEQKMHKKIIDQGVPDDVMLAYKNGHEPLPAAPLNGMRNKVGHKVRLTFKLECDEVWISTKERTEKVPMSNIRKIVNEPVKGKEEYHIMGFQLGTTENSRYWIYWVPAQYVQAIRSAIIN